VSRSVEAVSRRCRLTLVSMVSRCVDCVEPVSEGRLTVYICVCCVKVSIVSSVGVSSVSERVGVCYKDMEQH